MPGLTLNNSVNEKPSSSPAGVASFALARVKNEICLVQVSDAPASAFLPVDVSIFKHEFVSIFRFAQTTTLHPSDFAIIDWIDESSLRYEEENETVFLARDLMDRLRKLTTDPRKMSSRSHRLSQQRYRDH